MKREGGRHRPKRMGTACLGVLLAGALLAGALAGCGAGPGGGDPLPRETPTQTEQTPAQAEQTREQTEQSPAQAEQAPAEAGRDRAAHYVFQPKVCSSYMAALFGDTMVEAWYALVDAVMAGEDSFACPDAYTYDWVMGQFRDKCFPLLVELIDYCYDRGDPVHDGVATFTWQVPPEEAAGRIAEFAALVEGILNETLEDDYSDMEKALALYLYFSHHYTYDYETALDDSGYHDWLSAYRVLTGDTGICQEFSVAYSYLLLQAGVDATNMSGNQLWDNQGHQWSYVKINGQNFHIDPTFVIGTADCLSYFMMDDARREEDGFSRENFRLCSNYAQDHPAPDCAAEDDSFRALWGGDCLGFDHDTRTIYYEKYDDTGVWVTCSFDYTGW